MIQGIRLTVRIATALVLMVSIAPGLTADESKCQAGAAKEAGKFFKKTWKALQKCEIGIAKGDITPGTDCTLEMTAAAAIAKTESKLTDKLPKICTDAIVAGLPFAGGCGMAASVTDLSTCLISTHKNAVLEMMDMIFNLDATATKDQQVCLKALAGQSRLAATKRLNAIQKCLNLVGDGTLPPATNCLADTEAGDVASVARSKASAKMLKKCGDATTGGLSFDAPCDGISRGANIVACLFCPLENAVDELILTEYDALPNGGGGATPPDASAAVISNLADCVDGPMSRCRLGDYLIQNDQIRIVVQQLGRNLFGIGQYGGHIIDADLVRMMGDPDRDNFEEWSMSANVEATAHYTSISIINDGTDGNPAVIRVQGPDDLLDFLNPSSIVAGLGFTLPASANDQDLPVLITTDYILAPGKNYVEVRTTIENTDPMNVTRTYFGEFLAGSGQLELFQPGSGIGEPFVTVACADESANPCNFVAYAGFGEAVGVSYGYINNIMGTTTFTASGVTVPQLGVSIALTLIGGIPPNFVMQPMGTPNDSVTLVRQFVVGDGTVSSITDTRNELQCIATGTLSGTVTVGGSPAADADIVITSATGGAGHTHNIITHTRTDAVGAYSITLAPGDYSAMANFDGAGYEGGGVTPMAHSVTVPLYGATTQNFVLPANGTLQVAVVDETSTTIPAKVSIVGFDPSPDPLNQITVAGNVLTTALFRERFEDGFGFGLVKVLFLDQTGDCDLTEDNLCVSTLEPGTYQIVVSRGPEYSIYEGSLTITAGMTTTVNAQIAKVIDTTGFISADFHVHSIDSPDSETTREERVVSMLAEGVDFFASTDHDFRSDFQPDIVALGASALIGTAPGAEMTTFDYGHFNAWPMTVDSMQVNGGSVDHGGVAPDGMDFPSAGNYSLTPAQMFTAASADPGTNTIQINHFYDHFGVASGAGLAIDTGHTPPKSGVAAAARRLDPMFDPPMSPMSPGYFSSAFNALELWIGDDRSQLYHNTLGAQDPANLILDEDIEGGNFGDWFNLINQGIVRTAVSNSDTHRRVLTQAGTPRNMVASPTDLPGGLTAIADTLSANVNAGRSIGTNAPMVRVTSSATSTAENGGLALGLPTLISTTDGAVDITVEVESPLWAEFDRIEFYVNTVTTRRTLLAQETGAGAINVNRYCIAPFPVHVAGVDFTVNTVTDFMMIPGAGHLEATTTLNLTGLTEDVWVVAVVRGTDGVSKPLFPVIPNGLDSASNTNLAQLTDGNLGEEGMTAFAFTNPLFVDVDGGGWTAPGLPGSFSGCDLDM